MQRFFQFRLGALLLVVTFVSLCLAFWQSSIAPFQLQKEAIAELQKLDATIITRPANPYWMEKFVGKKDFVRVDAVTFSTPKLKNEHLAKLREIKGLRKLTISHCPITDDGLAQLRGVESLEELSLHGTSITNDGLRHVAQIRTLKSLDLRYTTISNDGLLHLARLVNLEEIMLPRGVNDRALAYIARLPRLRRADFSLTTVQPKSIPQLASCPLESPPKLNRPYRTNDLQYLVKLPSLTQLHLAYTVNDSHAAQISKLRQLKEISLSGRLTTKGLESLADLPNLESLTFSNNGFDEPEMAMLADKFRLRSLWLRSTSLKAESVMHLKRCRRLERCFVYSPWIHQQQGNNLADEFSHVDEFDVGSPSAWIYNEHNEPVSVAIERIPVSETDLEYLARFSKLETVFLQACQFDESPRVLQPLAALKRLKWLGLAQSNIQSKQLVALTDLPSLESVELHSTSVDDAAARYLVQLPRLHSLKLINSHFSDEGLSLLQRSPSLETLFIYSPLLTVDCLAAVRKMAKLKEFYVYSELCSKEKPITAASLVLLKADLPNVKVHIPHAYTEFDSQNHLIRITGFEPSFNAYDELHRLSHLEEVGVQSYLPGGTPNKGDQVRRMAAIAKIPNLKQLQIDGPRVASEALDQLANMPKLEALILRNGAVQGSVLPHIGKMTLLKTLSFHVDSNFSKSFMGQDFEPLKNLTRVEELTISGVGVDEKTIETVATWPRLRSVFLRNLGLNAACVAHFEQSRSLTNLTIQNVTLNNAALRRFQKERPNVEIVRH